jgi:IS1 family transposase
VQLDERWSFVAKKEKHCDRDDPEDDDYGDCWDHVAIDPESRLVLAVLPGRRTAENCQQLVEAVHRRTGGRTDLLLMSDAYDAYAEAIAQVYACPAAEGEESPPAAEGEVVAPKLPETLCYATVQKRREGGRVVEVIKAVVFGTLALLGTWLERSQVSRTVNTAFVERNHGTARHQDGRKRRKTYGFSKDRAVHEAVTTFVSYRYHFCWPVRTLREKNAEGVWGPEKTPAMAAGLTDHIWSLKEWLTYPVAPRRDTREGNR